MNSIIAVFLAGAEEGHGGSGNLIGVEPGLLFWTWLTFGLLLLVLYLFAWKPILSLLDEREERVRGDLERAEGAKSEAEALLAEHKSRMDNVEAEVSRILKESRRKGEEAASRIITEAKEESERIIEKGRASIEEERRKAVSELRSLVADASVDLAGRIIRGSIDRARHEALIEDFVERVGSPD